MTIKAKISTAVRLACGLGIAGILFVAGVTPAFAAGPKFTIYTSIADTTKAGEKVSIAFTIQNTGDELSRGPIEFSDAVSAGMKTPGNSFFEQFIVSAEPPFEDPEEERKEGSCKAEGLTLACSVNDALPPGGQLTMHFEAEVEPSATGTLTNVITASAQNVEATRSEQSIVVGEPPSFGMSVFAARLLGVDGSPITQAGSPPGDFTTTLRFRAKQGALYEFLPVTASPEQMKNVFTHLPVGLVGNPTATPVRCVASQLAEFKSFLFPACPDASQIGVVHVEIAGSAEFAALYNMEPPPGAAAELGFNVLGTVVPLDAYLRPSDNGIDVVSRNISTTVPITEVAVTVWGNPAGHSHDRERGEGCLGAERGATGHVCPSTAPETAFLRLPTSCSGEGLPFSADTNSYENPATEVTSSFTGATMSGCDRVPFSPTIFVQPTGTAANSPTGVGVQVSVPQNSNPEGVAEADLKKAIVTLPEGMALNPSAADGLQACTDAQLRVGEAGVAECPEASKVGTVLLHTPLLDNPIEGAVYVLSQESSDPESGKMFRIGMELRDDRHGIDIKVPGDISLDKNTGRITTTFDNTPQLPFSDITLHFKSGARAPLVTPASCEPQTTEADLYSWAAPSTPVHKKMTFDLTSGPGGSSCPPPSPFNPGFNAGVSSVQAGGYTAFLTTFTRSDADQSMQKVSVTLPLGVSGSLTGLPLCPEAQANAGTCSAASEIGSVTAGAGAGPTPFYVTGGKVFMTASYKGAPFGLSVVVPAKAGPFDLGTVVVRSKVEVDPHTAQLTVTTDPLPQIVGGVPVNLRLVNVTVNRPNFTFNRTNCDPTSVTGSVTGGQGAVAQVSDHFQVTNCGALGFKPKFSVSTSAKTSRANGASLDAKLSYPKTTGQANIARVKVSLPKQLPSRLTTLQKACPAATFDANPAACPAPSRIGAATATTPILPVPLSGPVYFVSHGGEAFPDLVIVLQGYGVTVDLVGTTFISKAGITSTTFKSVPDVPVGTFDLKLPQGPFSALAANGNLCNSSLKMPTAFIAQDGAEIHQSTPIGVAGCKPSISVLSHKVNNNKLTIVADVPSAGRLMASGKGLTSTQRRVGKAGATTLTLKLSGKERTILARHPGRRVKVRVKLVLTPASGRAVTGAVTVLMG
jgi:hypothetical protein